MAHNILVVGMTRHGKTEGVVKMVKKSNRAALFIKPGKPLKKGFIVADSRHKASQIIAGLKAGHKIEYRMNEVSKTNIDEMIYLVDCLIKAGFKESRPINLVIDEVNFFCDIKEGREKLETLSRMGVQHGLNTFFISQRFAGVPYTIMTQCEEIYFFKLSQMERGYVTDKKFDFDLIQNKIAENGKYSYMIFDDEKGLSGPFKEGVVI